MDELWERYCHLHLIQVFNNICREDKQIQTQCFWDKTKISDSAINYTYDLRHTDPVEIELCIKVVYSPEPELKPRAQARLYRNRNCQWNLFIHSI
jgi:hypothetical protein